MNEWKSFLACFSTVKYLSIFCKWIFSTMKDPNIGQRGFRLKLWYWSSGFWRIIQHRGKSCEVYLAVATGQFSNACTQFEIAQKQSIQMKSISLPLCIWSFTHVHSFQQIPCIPLVALVLKFPFQITSNWLPSSEITCPWQVKKSLLLLGRYKYQCLWALQIVAF